MKFISILTILFLNGYANGHSGGLNSQGCHAGSQPYHCHRSSSDMVLSSSGRPRLKCSLGSKSKDCIKNSRILESKTTTKNTKVKSVKPIPKNLNYLLPQATISEGNYLRLLTGFIKADILTYRTYFGGKSFTQKHIKGVHACINQVLWGKLQSKISVGKSFRPDYVQNINLVATHPLFTKCFKEQNIYKDLGGYILEEKRKLKKY